MTGNPNTESPALIWANLIHLSYNMWEDRFAPERARRCYDPRLRFDDALWNDLLIRMRDAGMNMVVLDLGDGVRYERHPEIAVQNAWSVERLREEIAGMRKLGIEPIPKLNFASTHDAWLGEYARRVSTPEYYAVCGDLIDEVSGIFERPRFFHIGMDEETAEHQRYYAYVVVRQFELYWHDLHFLADRVTETGSRPWIWSDYLWKHRQEFLDNMPQNILQSNWYYGEDFSPENAVVQAYEVLESAGYDQIPTGSNYTKKNNFRMTVEHCRATIPRSRLLGFMQTPWLPTLEAYRQAHEDAIDQVGDCIDT